MDIFELVRATQLLRYPERAVRPSGPMAAFVGRQLSEREIRDGFNDRSDGDELPDEVARAVRAFDVPALVGVRFACTPDTVHAALDDLLSRTLPGTTWHTAAMAHGRVLVPKYELLDSWFAAPADAATGQLMRLELTGPAVPTSIAHLDRLERMSWARARDWEWSPDTEVTVTIDRATWANVSGIGFGAGFYM